MQVLNVSVNPDGSKTITKEPPEGDLDRAHRMACELSHSLADLEGQIGNLCEINPDDLAEATYKTGTWCMFLREDVELMARLLRKNLNGKA